MSRFCKVLQGNVWQVWWVQVSSVAVSFGLFWFGRYGMASLGESSSGFVGFGVLRLGRYGKFRFGALRFVQLGLGKLRQVWKTPERRM